MSAMPDLEPFSDAVPSDGRPHAVLGVGKSWNIGDLRVAAGIRFFLSFPTFDCIDEQLCVFMPGVFLGESCTLLVPSPS